MINLFRFISILTIECCAAIISGNNPVHLYRRVVDIFYLKPRMAKNFTGLEEAYVVFLIILMADGQPKVPFDHIVRFFPSREDIGMFFRGVDKCRELGILDKNDYGYYFSEKRGHFSKLRNMYIHSAHKYPELTTDIYKMLRHVYYLTRCNPAWTFVSLRGDSEFRGKILENSKYLKESAERGFRSRKISE